jgi:bifunctional non-homologous end joining protein LigD
MSLTNYRKKRDFKKTSEPRGKAAARNVGVLRFVVQKHDASRLHYDFRLELEGVLKSWAVPKGPSLDPSRKSLAVQVEDHPLEYGDFEGVIPKGEYGGGTVLLWDTGTWEPLHDPLQGYQQGKLHFILHGTKLKGEWSLVRMHGSANSDGKNWLLIKLKDKYADGSRDILTEAPNSVKTKRAMAGVAGERDNVWSKGARKMAHLPNAIKSPLPETLVPQLAVLATHPPAGAEWLHEIKFDGYRLLAFVKSGKVTLRTRNGLDWTARFPAIARTLARLKADSAIVDGEVVVLDDEGRSDFQGLQAMLTGRQKGEPILYAFDLPFCNGFDLRETPLLARKHMLENMLTESNLEPRIRFSDHVLGDGSSVIDKACHLGLEGVISKKTDARYISRRDAGWLKSKCDLRQEFVIIGYTEGQGSRQGFGALLLGYHDRSKRLVYAGRVGTGFDDQHLRELRRRLTMLDQEGWPTDVPPPRREQKAAHWVKPVLVGEVRFTGWTRDGVLRHPAFIALRSDKSANQIVREDAVEPARVAPVNKSPPTSVRSVQMTHPDKVLYPETGTTKRDVASYYQSILQWILPHVVDRPLALVRCPAGRASQCFFQRNWSSSLPTAIDPVDVSDEKTKEIHVGVHDLEGMLSLVQIGVLEIHTWNCRSNNVAHPDQLIFDLDPGPDVTWKQVIEGARVLNQRLTKLGVPVYLKTSGGKGLHLTIPIVPNIDWRSTKEFCEAIAKDMVRQSDLFVANMRKDLRGGKIYIDYQRNGRGATAVAPYSTRARIGAPVSMPISWKELGKLKSADQFRVERVGRYLEKRETDPWQDFEESRVDLRKIVASESAA